jgi:hypothetical protein
MPAVLGLLEIPAGLAPSILMDDTSQRDAAYWPEPTHGVADRKQGIKVHAGRQAQRGLGLPEEPRWLRAPVIRELLQNGRETR